LNYLGEMIHFKRAISFFVFHQFSAKRFFSFVPPRLVGPRLVRSELIRPGIVRLRWDLVPVPGMGMWSSKKRWLFIQSQITPNPRSLKFIPGRQVLGDTGGTRDFQSVEAARSSPLASRLFAIQGISGVFLGSDYITVNIQNEADWLVIKPNVFATIMDFYASGLPILHSNPTPQSRTKTGEDQLPTQQEDPIVILIKELIDTRIRPSVQEDGGDIEFRSFENGIVKLQMQGSCVGCPSSAVTLRNGIENMLMHYVPEVIRVEEWTDPILDSVSTQQLAKLEQQLDKRNSD